jgi:hypothetical protein
MMPEKRGIGPESGWAVCFPLPNNETCKLKQSLGLRSPSLSGLAERLNALLPLSVGGRGMRVTTDHELVNAK